MTVSGIIQNFSPARLQKFVGDIFLIFVAGKSSRKFPVLPFLVFFCKQARNTTKKTRIICPCRTPKIPFLWFGLGGLERGGLERDWGRVGEGSAFYTSKPLGKIKKKTINVPWKWCEVFWAAIQDAVLIASKGTVLIASYVDSCLSASGEARKGR